MTMTIMYLTVAFLLAALAVSTYVRVRGLEFAYGTPLPAAVILLVLALTIDLAGQLTLSTQGWLNSQAQWHQAVPAMVLWKVGLAAQGVAIVFLVLGIWRLFAAVGQIVPAGKARVVRTPPPAVSPATATTTAADADTTD
jgi:hypothetical protein